MFRLFYYLYEMKAKEHIYNLRTNLIESGTKLINTTDQHLMYMLDEARAILASRKMDKKQDISLMAQYVDIKPSKAPKEEIGTVGFTKVLKVDIPTPISYFNGESIFTVGATDGQDSYTRISFSQLRTVLSRKYTASSPKWFWHNNAIYIINAEIDSLQKVRVRGIFAEPYKVEIALDRYKYLTPFDWEYPLSLNDQDTVYKIAMSGDLSWGDIATQAISARQQRQVELQNKDNGYKEKT